MTRLYVANTTLQHRELHYRRVGYNGVYKLDIPRGSQVPFPFDASSEEIAGIVEQQEGYGMVAAASVGQARAHIYTLYSVGKPISESQIRQAFERNLQLMGAEGLRLRQAAAIGISNIMSENDPENYQGARISVVEKNEDGTQSANPNVNESHLYRRSGDYENLGDVNAPVQAPATFRKTRRARKGLN